MILKKSIKINIVFAVMLTAAVILTLSACKGRDKGTASSVNDGVSDIISSELKESAKGEDAQQKTDSQNSQSNESGTASYGGKTESTLPDGTKISISDGKDQASKGSSDASESGSATSSDKETSSGGSQVSSSAGEFYDDIV